MIKNSRIFIYLSLILLSSCGGGSKVTLSSAAKFSEDANDISRLVSVLDIKFIQNYFKGYELFSSYPVELRMLPSVTIPSQHSLLYRSGVMLQFSHDLWSPGPNNGTFLTRLLKSHFNCSSDIPQAEDQDFDNIPQNFNWSTQCKAKDPFERGSKEMETELTAVSVDADDNDPFSSFENKINYKIVTIQEPGILSQGPNPYDYSFPSLNWVTVLDTLTKTKKNSDLTYSIFTETYRRSTTAEGRKSGAGFQINMMAMPEIIERSESYRSNDYNMVERTFKDSTIRGQIQISDGFAQFVIEDKVWNLKISSTPLSYKYYGELSTKPVRREPFPANEEENTRKFDLNNECSRNFASGTITMTDVAGNRFEFRYSQNPEVGNTDKAGPLACKIEYYFNDQKVDFN